MEERGRTYVSQKDKGKIFASFVFSLRVPLAAVGMNVTAWQKMVQQHQRVHMMDDKKVPLNTCGYDLGGANGTRRFILTRYR